VLANDSDPDGDSLAVTDVTAPANGTAAANPDGTITYTPDPGFVGTDEFRYTISDGTSTSSARVTVTVAPRPNSDPVANDDAATTKKNKAVRIAVLANDTDPDGDPLVVGSVSEAPHGTVTINADGTVTYRPDNGYSGTDSFTYTASDGRGGRDTATVSIVVKRL
jgi:VCBS repeat-containing protein